MIFLALLLWVRAGFSLEIGLELGWAGRPVLGAVNPLWITITSTEPTPVRGELRVTMEFGSPWRGESSYAARVPLVVGALAKARLLLPWPVQAGAFLVRAAVFSGAHKLGEGELRFSAEPGLLRAGVGPPREPLDLFLAPAELPSDPLLLSPFSELRVFLPLRAAEEDVVRAWQVFWSGEVRVEAEAVRTYLSGLRPPSPGWAALFPGLFAYLVALSLALPRLAQGRPQFALVFLGFFLALAAIYAVSREALPLKATVKIRIERPGFTSFSLELLGIAPWVREDLALDGWWAELLPTREWEGRDLLWQFTGETWQTLLSLQPGVPRVLFRIAKEPPLPGEVVPAPHLLLRSLSLAWERATVLRAGGDTLVVRLR